MTDTEKKKKKKRIPTAVYIVLMVILIGVFGYSAYRLITYEVETSKADAVDEELLQYKPEIPTFEPEAEVPGSPRATISPAGQTSKGTGEMVVEIKNQAILDLKARNNEFIGWLNVKDTKIDFAFAHTVNPGYDGRKGEFYLYRDINKEHSISGSVFLDYRNDPEFKDAVSLLYGHHMQKSAKFTHTDAFVNKDYMLEHQELTIMLENRILRGKIFAYCLAAYDQYETFSGEVLQDPTLFLEYLKKNSRVYLENDFDANDKYIVLVTCNYSINNGRALVVAGVKNENKA